MSAQMDAKPAGSRNVCWTDFASGLVLIGIGCVALFLTRNLPGMRGVVLGPGSAPRLFSGLLIFLGGIIAAASLSGPPYQSARHKLRGPVLILVSIISFALTIRPLGLVLASFISFLLAALASPDTKWAQAAVTAAALTTFCVLLFVHLLKLPFAVWPII
jgi:putative tricarboxylic transport membrane protein